jgi:hypothetical protein
MEPSALSTANSSATTPCCGGGESDKEEGEENEVGEVRNQITNDDDGKSRMHYRLAKERIRIPICRHQFCRECLIRHCQHSISIKAIPIVCPEDYKCATVLPDDMVKDLFLRRWTTSSRNTITTSRSRCGRNSSSTSTNRPTIDLGQSDEDETSLRPPSFDAAASPKHPHEEWSESQKQQKQQQDSIRSEEENATRTASVTFTTTTTAVPFAVPTIAYTTDAVVVAMGEEGGDGVFWLDPSSSPAWLKYQRFQRMLQDPSLIPCTQCQELLSLPPPPPPPPLALQETERNLELSSPENESLTKPQERHHYHQQQQQPEPLNRLTCQSCGHIFCRTHGDSHSPQISCEEYSRSTDARQLKRSERAIRKFTKPCSHCGAFIEKISGCDFMTCGFCHKEMCFKCGTHVHLSGLSGDTSRFCKHCRRREMDDRPSGIRWCYYCSILCHLPLYVAYAFIVGVLAIVTCGCGCCFGCGTLLPPQRDGPGVVSLVKHGEYPLTGDGEGDYDGGTTKRTEHLRNGRGHEASSTVRNITTNATDDDNHDDSPGASGNALAIPSGTDNIPTATTTTTTTTTTATNEEKETRKTRAFQPLEGFRCVLIMILLPFLCLFWKRDDDTDEDDHDDDFGDNVHRDLEAGLAAVVTS